MENGNGTGLKVGVNCTGTASRLLHPSFWVPSARSLNLPDPGGRTFDFLARVVSRTRTDLLSHVRRVLIARRSKDAERAYGALIDLFITLGTRGRPLRVRLLASVTSVLRAEQQRLLEAHLDHPLDARQALKPAATFSMLTGGWTEGQLLPLQTAKQSLSADDALAAAGACLEYGQVAEAGEILGAALLSHPDDARLRRQLEEVHELTKRIELQERQP